MGILGEDTIGRIGSRFADPGAIYSELSAEPGRAAVRDSFTAHVFACVLSLTMVEAGFSGRKVGDLVGLEQEKLRSLVETWLPAAGRLVDFAQQPERIVFEDEEAQLRELLERHRSGSARETDWLIAIVARRAMSPHHLWQDLGLENRDELSRLMTERFPILAARNVSNMKWKKFFYRSICELEGFVLCAAPSCRECGDFSDCFGDESGESVFARLGRGLHVQPSAAS